MVRNFAHLIDSVGFVPNGNRNYYLTRSQPPFFSLIVKELAEYDSLAASHYLPAMVKEYSFWMNGRDSVKDSGDATQHVVRMADGTFMNRYYDRGEAPRPEAFKEDYKLGQQSTDPKRLYRDLRSAAESGWDFSSRWFADGNNLSSIHTTDIVPVDLNCLLMHLEHMIAEGYRQQGDVDKARRFNDLAVRRSKAIIAWHWDADKNFFFDYDFRKGKRTDVKSLAGVFPLFFGIVPKEMASKSALVIEQEFLKPGGLVTTLTNTHQQWDAPNGWAPLQWMTYKALKNYQLNQVADKIRGRWLRQNLRVFNATGKMMEKYNVMDTVLIAGGGEYPNQDGFGWTNGVALAFIQEGRYKLDVK
jgi:alpha,alpha-trehalase